MRARPLPSARDDLDAALAQVDELRRQVSTLLATQRELSSLLVAAQSRNGEQLKLLVAVRALIDARDAAGALESLDDILRTVVGAAEFTIYALEPREGHLVPVGGSGAPVRAADRITLGRGWLGTIIESGRVYLARDHEEPGTRRPRAAIEAVVPLRVLERVVGAIVIGNLLPHREPLDLCDREVLGVLGAYAATAIIAADRRDRWRRLPDLAR